MERVNFCGMSDPARKAFYETLYTQRIVIEWRDGKWHIDAPYLPPEVAEALLKVLNHAP